MLLDLSLLSIPQEPWVLQTYDSFEQLVAQVKTRVLNIHVVVLEGKAMCGTEDFYNELTEKLKLPDYFGRNLNALDECLTDLEWLGLDGRALVVIVRDAEAMMHSDRELYDIFIGVMRDAGKEWSIAVTEGNEWDRPPVPFHVVFDYNEQDAFKVGDLPRLEVSGLN